MGFALNIEQQNAVTHSGCPLLIVADPGSGKTRVIIERILHLIKLGLKPSEILCQIFNFTYCHTRDGPVLVVYLYLANPYLASSHSNR